MDLAERLSDLQQRSAEALTDDQAKKLFLELLSDGKTIGEAGREAGRTPTWFRRRRNPEGANYDPEFTEAFNRITAPGGEHKAALVDDIVTAMVKSAKDGNVRAQEKLLSAWSEEFQFLRPIAAGGDMNVQQLQVFFGELPLEKLLELKQARELARSALPVIDAE